MPKPRLLRGAGLKDPSLQPEALSYPTGEESRSDGQGNHPRPRTKDHGRVLLHLRKCAECSGGCRDQPRLVASSRMK